jgi:hypothetical protein
MTEQEWQACVLPWPLLEQLDSALGERKARLFLIACCRRAWPVFTDDRSRRAVEAAEQFADGAIDAAALEEAHRQALEAPSFGLDWYPATAALHPAIFPLTRTAIGLGCARLARAAAGAAAEHHSAAWRDRLGEEYAAQCDLLRDVAPNPLRPASVVHPAWLAWSDGIIPKLAQAIYEERAFDRLPVLADALEDAGCNDRFLLDHGRESCVHARGCWVLDLVLGRR